MQIKEVQVLLFLILIKTTKVKSERNLKKKRPHKQFPKNNLKWTKVTRTNRADWMYTTVTNKPHRSGWGRVRSELCGTGDGLVRGQDLTRTTGRRSGQLRGMTFREIYRSSGLLDVRRHCHTVSDWALKMIGDD